MIAPTKLQFLLKDALDSAWVSGHLGQKHDGDLIASQLAEKIESLAPPSGEGVDKFVPHWPEGVEHNTAYELPCDDKGRNGASWLRVVIANDGDVHLVMQDWEDFPNGEPSPIPSLRCRTYFGGGRNDRTHQALLNLAQAIMLDTGKKEATTPQSAPEE